MEVENSESVVENTGPVVENDTKEVETVTSVTKGDSLPVYVAKDKILCDLCGKGYAKAGIAKHRKLCLVKNKVEDLDSKTKKEISIAVVPVEPESAPPPPKLERQTNKSYSREEALAEPEEDEYEKAVKAPVAPTVLKPLTRVDKLRMMARSGLP